LAPKGVEAGTSLMDFLRKEASGLLLGPLRHIGIHAFVPNEATNAFHLKNTLSLSIISK
jgi:hypothetical protein